MADDVFVTRRIPEAGLDLLREAVRVRLFPHDRPPTRAEFLEGVRGCRGLLCLLTERVDGEVLDAAPLRVVSNYAVGTDNVDVAAATERGVLVTNTPVEGLRESPADFAMALLLAVSRRVLEGDAMVREGRFRAWGPRLLLGTEVYGKTLGIVGAGRIGSAVAERARAFRMRLLYHSRSRVLALEEALDATFVSLEDLLAASDFVSLHVPLTPETHHLIGPEELRRMKSSAFLINTSRGPVVDEAALAAALEEGEIAGAALDVFENEPEVHPGLRDRPNAVLTPHIGSATRETRTEMAVVAATNLLDALAGRRPRHLVNPEALSYQAGE